MIAHMSKASELKLRYDGFQQYCRDHQMAFKDSTGESVVASVSPDGTLRTFAHVIDATDALAFAKWLIDTFGD